MYDDYKLAGNENNNIKISQGCAACYHLLLLLLLLHIIIANGSLSVG
jgi:hypothetical protein